eukprot:2234489-Pleurochrysis_carterae.AAC.2
MSTERAFSAAVCKDSLARCSRRAMSFSSYSSNSCFLSRFASRRSRSRRASLTLRKSAAALATSSSCSVEFVRSFSAFSNASASELSNVDRCARASRPALRSAAAARFAV